MTASTFIAPADVIRKIDIAPGMTVAHLGCGTTGFFAVPIARQVGDAGKVYVVDILKTALETTMKHAQLEGVGAVVDPVWSNLEVYGATKIPEGTLDRALLINVLYQVEDIATAVREAARLLRSGGRLLVVDWKGVRSPFGPRTAHRVRPDDVHASAAAAGLDFVEDEEFGAYHYGLEFVKK